MHGRGRGCSAGWVGLRVRGWDVPQARRLSPFIIPESTIDGPAPPAGLLKSRYHAEVLPLHRFSLVSAWFLAWPAARLKITQTLKIFSAAEGDQAYKELLRSHGFSSEEAIFPFHR